MELDINLLKLLVKLKIVDYLQEHEYGGWHWYWHYWPYTEIGPFYYFNQSPFLLIAIRSIIEIIRKRFKYLAK